MDAIIFNIKNIGAATIDVPGLDHRSLLNPGGMGDQIDGDMVLVNGDIFMGFGQTDQGLFDFPARQILGVNDAVVGMPAFPAEIKAVVNGRRRAGEFYAQGSQFPDRFRPFSDDRLHDRLVTKAVARRQGILNMRLKGVDFADDRRDTALGAVGAAVIHRFFGDNDHLAGFSRLKREFQPRDTASDDQKIRLDFHIIIQLSLKIILSNHMK